MAQVIDFIKQPANVQNDIVKYIDKCLKYADTCNGCCSGEYLRNVLVPRHLLKTPICGFKSVDFYFFNANNMENFLKYKYFVKNENDEIILTRLGVLIAIIKCNLVNSIPPRHINFAFERLVHKNGQFAIVDICTFYHENYFNFNQGNCDKLIEDIESKKARILLRHIDYINNSSDVSSIHELINNGWVINFSDGKGLTGIFTDKEALYQEFIKITGYKRPQVENVHEQLKNITNNIPKELEKSKNEEIRKDLKHIAELLLKVAEKF